MAIKSFDDGGFVVTGPHIRVYQLAVVKTRIKLEKMMGGPSPTKCHWCRVYNLSVRTKHEKIIEYINNEIDQIMREHPNTKED